PAPFPRGPAALPAVQRSGGTHPDHVARAARPQGPGGNLPPLAALSAGLDLRPPAPATALRQLGRHRVPRPGRAPVSVLTGPARRWLPRLPWPDLAGKAPRPRDRDRPRRRAAVEDRGQGRPRRPGILRYHHRASARAPAGRV